MININISLFSGKKKIAKQKDALEAARKALLDAHGWASCQKGYCDGCPISHIGVGTMHHNFTREQSEEICDLRRGYSK